MDIFTKNELSGLKSDIIGKESAIEVDKMMLANELRNGLGEEIQEYLKNPPQLNVKKQRLYNIKNCFKRIGENLKEIIG